MAICDGENLKLNFTENLLFRFISLQLSSFRIMRIMYFLCHNWERKFAFSTVTTFSAKNHLFDTVKGGILRFFKFFNVVLISVTSV